MRALIPAVLLLAAAPTAATATADPSYGSNGVFAVTGHDVPGWATTFIPPGRYRADQAPSLAPFQSAPGFWLRCSAFPCSPHHPQHITAGGAPVRDAPTFVDILPTDVAVFLGNTTLTPVG